MRLRLLALLAVSSLGLSAATPSIVRVWGDFVPAESFERIAEYFGAPEKHAGRSILRTQPAQRSGYYFLVRVKDKDSIPAGSHWQVEVLRQGQRKPVSYDFAITDKSSVYQLGLTGSDWVHAKEVPMAWKLTLVGADGATVLAHDSFLWN